jgi:hypothetical protein
MQTLVNCLFLNLHFMRTQTWYDPIIIDLDITTLFFFGANFSLARSLIHIGESLIDSTTCSY